MGGATAGGVRKVVVLGSTGSVGTQALDVVRNHRDRYEVVALAAGRNAELLEAQRVEFGVAADHAPHAAPAIPTRSPSSPRTPTPTSC